MPKSFVYGKPLKPVIKKGFKFPTAEEVEDYAKTLLEFREWCVAHNLNFRVAVIRSLALFQENHNA